MKRSILYIFMVFVLFEKVSMAELPLSEPSYLPVPEIPYSEDLTTLKVFHRTNSDKKKEGSVDPISVTASELANALKEQFKASYKFLEKGAPSCADKNSEAYSRALFVAGHFDECVERAVICANDSATISSAPILQGALCESKRYNYDGAERLFQLATQERFSSDASSFAESVFQYAAYTLRSPGGGANKEAAVEAILQLNARWSESDRKLWQGVIRRSAQTSLLDLKKDQVDLFLSDQLKSAQGHFRELLLITKIGIAERENKFQEAFSDLKLGLSVFTDPSLWYYSAYVLVYRGFDHEFREAKKIYDAYDQFSHPFMSFPEEFNTLNYKEIYENYCSAVLLQGDELKEFEAFKEKIRFGAATIEASLSSIQKFMSGPPKSDVLTTYGGLLALTGRHNEAIDAYWNAHRLCRYFNRANWGLSREKMFLRLKTEAIMPTEKKS